MTHDTVIHSVHAVATACSSKKYSKVGFKYAKLQVETVCVLEDCILIQPRPRFMRLFQKKFLACQGMLYKDGKHIIIAYQSILCVLIIV